jgi:methylated-DNA-[protein]-cysteine S-methyltransferase
LPTKQPGTQPKYFEAHRKMRLFCLLVYADAMKTLPASDLFTAIMAAPFGAIGIRSDAEVVRELVYLPAGFAPKMPLDAVAEIAMIQLDRYLADPDFRFDLPLAAAGTVFQRKVWAAISSIPRGQVLTYGQLARQVQSAPRAVGQACGANWFPLVIPCHRVTAAGGLGGFSNHADADGFHVGVKRWLLAHEGLSY